MEPLLGLMGLACALGAGLTALAEWGGRRWGILDLPDTERKFHARATPRTGGLAICASFCAVTLLGTSSPPGLAGWTATPGLAWLLGSTIGLCLVGLWDDRHGMRARTKLLWQIAAIAPYAWWGRASQPLVLFGDPVASGWLSEGLVLMWLVSCCNFINLLDGLDGLAGSVGLVICLAAGLLGGWQGQPETVGLCLVLAGSLLGFLVFNWPPARLFMGDCGSLPLGFLAGALSLQASAKKTVGLTLVVPALLLAVPLFDTAMAIVRRKLNGRKIGHGDRGHIHHCLRDRGLSASQTLWVVCGLSACAALAAVVATIVNSDLFALVAGLGLVLAVVVGRVFGFQETMLLARHLSVLWGLVRELPRQLRARLLAMRLVQATQADPQQLWSKTVRRARRLPVAELEYQWALDGHSAEGSAPGRQTTGPQVSNKPSSPPRTRRWRGAEQEPQGGVWELDYRLQQPDGSVARCRVRGFDGELGLAQIQPELPELLRALCSVPGAAWPPEDTPLAESPLAESPTDVEAE
ncbi:MAG: glycosyltransferase family 4 protein, partial [Planctomycetaceae bacterium]